MKIFGVPVLKFRTKDKLHISKEPGIISWVLLIVFTSFGFILQNFLVPDYFLPQLGCITLCLLIGLYVMETWEDFVMDREENLVTLVRKSWYHGFSTIVPDENVERFPLSSVSAVVFDPNTGIEIIKYDGGRTVIPTDNSNFKAMKKLRKEISTFLHLERIENIKTNDYVWDDDYHDYVWWLADTDQERESDTETQSTASRSEHSFDFDRSIKIISGP